MKKVSIFLVLLMAFIPISYAGISQDVRISGYDKIGTSYDTISAPNNAIQLSMNKSVPCGMVYLCASPANTIGVAWGDSSVASLTTGVRLVGIRSCDVIYVDNVQDIWVSDDSAAVSSTVSYTYFQ